MSENSRIKCGKCATEWDPNVYNNNPFSVGAIQNLKIKCPMCGFNRSEIKESKEEKNILKG